MPKRTDRGRGKDDREGVKRRLFTIPGHLLKRFLELDRAGAFDHLPAGSYDAAKLIKELEKN